MRKLAKTLNVMLPGDTPPESPTPETQQGTQNAADDADAAQAAHDAEAAQLRAALAQANAELQALRANPAQPALSAGPARLIGEDWGNRTSAEAKAAGVTKTVLCSDGYYVP